MLWKPDQTFYPSPRMAMKAPREKLGYVVTFNLDPEQRQAATRCACSTSTRDSPTYAPGGRPPRDAERRRRAASLRLERVQRGAVPLLAASARRAPLPAGAGPALLAHLHHRHQARPAHAEDRQDHRGRGDRDARRLQPAAYDPLRPRRDLRQRAGRARTATARAGSFCSTTRASTCWAGGRSIAGRSISPTISGGTSATTSRSPANGARPNMVENGRQPRAACSGASYGHRAAHVGPAQAPPSAGARPRRGASDGARAAPGARSDQGLRLRLRRHLDQGPLRRRSGCGIARRQRQLGDARR